MAGTNKQTKRPHSAEKSEKSAKEKEGEKQEEGRGTKGGAHKKQLAGIQLVARK